MAHASNFLILICLGCFCYAMSNDAGSKTAPFDLTSKNGPASIDWNAATIVNLRPCISEETDFTFHFFAEDHLEFSHLSILKFSLDDKKEQTIFIFNGISKFFHPPELATRLNVTKSVYVQRSTAIVTVKAVLAQVNLTDNGYYGLQVSYFDNKANKTVTLNPDGGQLFKIEVKYNRRYRLAIRVCKRRGNCFETYEPLLSIPYAAFGRFTYQSSYYAICSKPPVRNGDIDFFIGQTKYNKTAEVGHMALLAMEAPDIVRSIKQRNLTLQNFSIDITCVVRNPPLDLCPYQLSRTLRITSGSSCLKMSMTAILFLILSFGFWLIN